MFATRLMDTTENTDSSVHIDRQQNFPKDRMGCRHLLLPWMGAKGFCSCLMTGLGLAIEGFWVSYNQGCTGRLAREKGFLTVKFGEGGGGEVVSLVQWIGGEIEIEAPILAKRSLLSNAMGWIGTTRKEWLR